VKTANIRKKQILFGGVNSMNTRRGVWSLSMILAAALLLFPSLSGAQENAGETKGIDAGNYNTQESFEGGYRSTWINGNQNNYGTFVNLGSGLRLLNYTASMRSLDHRGILFDNLNFSNFGYGGDPNNVSRLRIEKNKWYDLQVNFRRDKNLWNFNLFGNPLNPPTTNPVTNPVFAETNAVHALERVRRMQEYNLTLLPQSRMRFRLGYSRNVDEGPSFSSSNNTNGPDNFLLAEKYRVTSNSYRMGVDFRFLPRTTISYDQVLQYEKEDTIDSLASTPFQVANPAGGTIPVDVGVDFIYPPQAGSRPCIAPPPFLPSGLVDPNCRAITDFSRYSNPRNFAPTERIGFQSTYFKRLEMAGSASYTTNHNAVSSFNTAYNEWTNSATVNTRGVLWSGPSDSRMVTARANWNAIYAITSRLRVHDSINYENWRDSGYMDQLTTTLFAARPTIVGQIGITLPEAPFSPLVAGAPSFAGICAGPSFNATTCPQHTTAAPPDVTRTLLSSFLGHRTLSNTVQLESDITRRLSARLGYMYQTRVISDTLPTGADYYEAAAVNPINLNHLPPLTTGIYFPGGNGGTLANRFFAARGLCAPVGGALPVTCTQNADGSITYTAATVPGPIRELTMIHGNVLLAGFAYRPVDALRINADFEFGYNDRAYTQISPRQFQTYKVHANYRMKTWASIDGAIDIREDRDNVSQINYLDHLRTYSFGTVLMPKSSLTLNLGYNYTNIAKQSIFCFRETIPSPGIPAGTYGPCPYFSGTTAITWGATSFYTNQQSFAYGDVLWKPMKRITAGVGYMGTFTNGNTLYLNPRMVGGTIAFNYQKPFASIQIDLYKGLSYKTTWNYYGYNLKTPMANALLQPIGQEDFNGSTATFSARYNF
jgi:hypothetical protein